MQDTLLSVYIKCYEPKTYGNNDLERKRELRDLILAKIDDISKIQQKTRSKKLSIDVCFNLYSESTASGRKTKDLDNMLKIFCDVFPDYIDRNKTTQGLGLIEGDSDDMIFEINSEKRLVGFESEEGIDFSIYEYPKLC